MTVHRTLTLAVAAIAALIILAAPTQAAHSNYVPRGTAAQCTHSQSYENGRYYYFSHHHGPGSPMHGAAVYKVHWWGLSYEGHWHIGCNYH